MILQKGVGSTFPAPSSVLGRAVAGGGREASVGLDRLQLKPRFVPGRKNILSDEGKQT